MNTYRVYVQGMPHQDIKGDCYSVEGGVLEILVEATKTKDSGNKITYREAVASFREWNFVKQTNTEPVLTKQEWMTMADAAKLFQK